MSKRNTLENLRLKAVSQSLFPQTTLAAALERLAFVQADPIRSPAAAQDLILRHRVKGYRDGDLDRHYASLDIEEDFLYAYGFLPREIRNLLYPRKLPAMSKFDRKVLETVQEFGEMHPRDLEPHCGGERVINAWGGYSKATKKSLEQLHYHGLLRVARREKGVRIYAAAKELPQLVTQKERCRKLAMVIAQLLAPAPLRSLQETVGRLRYSSPDIGSTKTVLQDLFASGELEKQEIDGVMYVWPSCWAPGMDGTFAGDDKAVAILAPFDPVVWDRRRFEHLWGWQYRFEAYTPIAKRVRGYYAMPLLWGANVIGWANLSFAGGNLEVDLGYHGKRPREAAFRKELEDEISRIEKFLRANRK